MRIAIIALVIALAALGLAGFATFASLNDDEAAPVAESGWSEAECKSARWLLDSTDGQAGPLLALCGLHHDCVEYDRVLIAINDNCP
jgi:hypothetical protein